MHIAQKFEVLLEMHRRPDGRKWSGQEIDEATGGVDAISCNTGQTSEQEIAYFWPS